MNSYKINSFEENFGYGLIPATSEEAKLCEEKERSIGAIPVGFVKSDDKNSEHKYYKLVSLNEHQLNQKIKAEKIKRLGNIDRQTRATMILTSVGVGFLFLMTIMMFISFFK